MKDSFAITGNVQRFLAGVETLTTAVRGRTGLMLAYGPPGTGKTETGQWYAANHDVPYVRCKDITSRRSLLENIVGELGLAAKFRAEDLFRQAEDELVERNGIMILDEVDYLTKSGAIEVIRDLNDVTNFPILLMGMEETLANVRAYQHLYDRLTAIVRFNLFDNKELTNLAGQVCEVRISADGISFIKERSKGRLRLSMQWFAKAEGLARRNQIDEITAAHLQTCKEK